MLRQVFFIAFVLLTSFGYSQNKNVLDGIFEIRLGMSENEIREVVETKHIQHSFNVAGVGSIRLLILKEYEPIERFVIKDIDLTFFENKLYKIEIKKEKDNLEDLLTEKYGKPKRKENKNLEAIPYAERTSRYDHHRIVSETITYTWKTGDKNITCTSDYESYTKEYNVFYNLLIEDEKLSKRAISASIEHSRNENKIKKKARNKLLEEI